MIRGKQHKKLQRIRDRLKIEKEKGPVVFQGNRLGRGCISLIPTTLLPAVNAARNHR